MQYVSSKYAFFIASLVLGNYNYVKFENTEFVNQFLGFISALVIQTIIKNLQFLFNCPDNPISESSEVQIYLKI